MIPQDYFPYDKEIIAYLEELMIDLKFNIPITPLDTST
jgi:hypothetical protein